MTGCQLEKQFTRVLFVEKFSGTGRQNSRFPAMALGIQNELSDALTNVVCFLFG